MFCQITILYRSCHGDVIRRVTWSPGIPGWQKICGWRASRVFCRDSFPVCLHLLTNKIMIMFCIGAEYIEHCSDGWFYFFYHPKKGNRRKHWLNAFSCKQWGSPSLKNINRGFRHFISLGFYYNTFNITESTTTGCNEQNSCCKWHKRTVPVSVTDGVIPWCNNKALKSSGARAQKRNKTKSLFKFKSRGHTGVIIRCRGRRLFMVEK